MKSISFKLLLFWIFCLPVEIFGWSYECISNGLFSTIHILTVNPEQHEIFPVRAKGDRETVLALANRYQAEAAVNGGFWKWDGSPAGILKIQGKWYGTPTKPRGAIGWASGGKNVMIDRVLTNYSLKDVYYPDEIVVLPASDPPQSTPEEWCEMEHIVGGTPVLIMNGQIIDDFSSEQTLESFLLHRHPRTAVGIKENGEWVFAVVDGRYFGFLGGMTMNELAEFMLMLGCIKALNLDGGSSSTMVIEGAVVNEPNGTEVEVDKLVEPVSDAVLILLQQEHHLFLK